MPPGGRRRGRTATGPLSGTVRALEHGRRWPRTDRWVTLASLTTSSKRVRVAHIEAYRGVWPEIHPSAFLHKTAVIVGRVRIGEGASIWPHATLRGDEGEIVIGARTNIQDGCTVHLTGGQSSVEVGDEVTVGHNVVLHGCRVAAHCLIGMGSILLDNCEIGEGTIIGAGSLVTANKRVAPHTLGFGNPFRAIRKTTTKDQAWINYCWRHYLETVDGYRRPEPDAKG